MIKMLKVVRIPLLRLVIPRIGMVANTLYIKEGNQ